MGLRTFLSVSLAVALAGCAGDITISGPARVDGEGGGGTEPQFPEFDGATMQVYSPLPAEIYMLGEDLELDAEILDADGDVMDFDDIVWEIDSEDEPVFVGANGDVEFDWGIHTFTVTADLPNGDRLQTLIGAVRVQSEHTGVYSGTFGLNVNAEVQGTPITAACLGGLDFVIDMAGENLLGEDSGCTINLFVLGDFDVAFGVVGDVDHDDVDGAIQLNLGFFDVPVGFEGELDDGELYAEFSGSVILFDFEGSIDAQKVSPYVDQ